MAFPKVEYPLTTIELGDVKRKFRPMLVKEEKILLTARQTENQNDIFTAIRQVVNNCCVDDDFNVDDLPIYLLEWAFLNLRISSIGNTVELAYRDAEDELEYKFTVSLDDIKIIKSQDAPSKTIEVGDDMTIEMKYPPASLYANEDFVKSEDPAQYFEELLLASIDSVYQGDEVFTAKDATRQELTDFVESLDSTTYRKMQDFLASVPHMEHVIEYKNKKGTERKIVLRTLNDFFML